MRRQGVRPSRVTYTAAVAGLNRPRYADWGPKLENLARLLQDRSSSGDDAPGASRPTDGDVGLEETDGGVVGEGSSSGVFRVGAGSGPSPEDFDGTIEALGDAGNADGAACLLRVMRQEGFHASPRAYRSVIYACARVGHLTEAITLAKEMEISSSEVQVGLRPEMLEDDDVEHASVGRTKVGREDDEAEGEDRHSGRGGVGGVDVLAPSTATVDRGIGGTAGGGGGGGGEGGEFDLGVVYNCIVCNFARAATQKTGDGYADADRGFSDICDQRRRGNVGGASPRGGQRRGLGGRGAAPRGGGGGGLKEDEEERDEGLVALLLGVAERAEGSLEDEASYGGVEVASAEGVPSSSPVGVVEGGVAPGPAVLKGREGGGSP